MTRTRTDVEYKYSGYAQVRTLEHGYSILLEGQDYRIDYGSTVNTGYHILDSLLEQILENFEHGLEDFI